MPSLFNMAGARVIHIGTDDATDDAAWFAAHPERQYRVRPLNGEELAALPIGAVDYAVADKARDRWLYLRGPIIPNTDEAAALMTMPVANQYRH